MKEEVREVPYVCRQCGAEDAVKLYQAERTPMAINCYKCKAGQKMELPLMIQTKTGMFPIIVPE